MALRAILANGPRPHGPGEGAAPEISAAHRTAAMDRRWANSPLIRTPQLVASTCGKSGEERPTVLPPRRSPDRG